MTRRLAILVAAMVLAGGCAEHAGSLTADDYVVTADRATTTSTRPERPRPTTTSTSLVVERRPEPADFQVAIVETSRQCFGSAGCLVEGYPDVATVTADDLDLFGCTLTFQVPEAESTLTDSVTLHSGGTYEYHDMFVSTAADVPLTAVVTQVVCR